MIAENEDDDRTKKAKERLGHYLAQQVAEGDVQDERVADPREEKPEEKPENAAPEVEADEDMKDPEEFEIGTPGKAGPDRADEGLGDDVLDDGPTSFSERRFRSPVRPPAVKRKTGVHDEEPGTKRIILDDPSDEEGDMSLSDLSNRREDEIIVCRALLGRSLYEV